jgi:tetratricopeptide (TPR) repeat protein
MYKVLVAEVAVQRGHYDLAVRNYLELARQVRDPQLAERAARIALFSKQNPKAVEASRLWVEIAPTDIEAHQVLAAMLIRAGEVESAQEHLEYVLAHDSEHTGENLKKIVNFLGHEKDKRMALRVMERLVQRRQDDPDALFAYALLAMRADETAKARTAMEKLLQTGKINNNMVVAYLGILQKQGETPAALSWLEGALAKDPKNFELRILYARLLADAKRYPAAREQFETVAKEQPQNADVQFALGLLSMQEERTAEAQQHFAGLTQREPYQNEASYYLGQIAESNKNYEEALRWYSAINQGEIHFDAQLSSALVLAKLKRYDEADARLRAVTAKSPEQTSRVVRVRGELLTEQGNYQAAMNLYDEALGDKYDPDLLYTRAMVAEKLGRIDILERDLKLVLQKEPDNAQALNALGFTLADQTGRQEEAYGLIKHALELRPNDHYILDSMGWVLYRLGRLPEAASHLRRAKDLRNDPEIAAHLGEVLWKMGDKDGARAAWQSGLQASPNDPKLINVMQRLAR